MKIEGPNQTGKAGQTKKSEKAKSAGGPAFSDMLGGADETSDVNHTSTAGAIARIDVLLAAQTADDPAERATRGRMRKRADHILRSLDKIRLGILTGNMTVGNVLDIADVVASHREKITDPQLSAILDEIDLRAQIEIAKMRLALEASKVL
jgi:hypothetical protein